jgi:NADH-quinone oxidoreductase subunit H
LAEYINMVTVSALATTLFLGGWRAPAPISTIWEGANSGWWPLAWFVIKLFAFIFVFIWLRGTLPRLRYDQFMKFGWKVLIPVSLVWIVIVATARALRQSANVDSSSLLVVVGVILTILVVLSFVLDAMISRRMPSEIEPEPEFDAFAGGFPVPPLPGQKLPTPAASAQTISSTEGDSRG